MLLCGFKRIELQLCCTGRSHKAGVIEVICYLLFYLIPGRMCSEFGMTKLNGVLHRRLNVKGPNNSDMWVPTFTKSCQKHCLLQVDDLISAKFRHFGLVIVCPSGGVRPIPECDVNSNIPVGRIKQTRLTAPFNCSSRWINKRLLGPSRGYNMQAHIRLFVWLGSGLVPVKKGRIHAYGMTFFKGWQEEDATNFNQIKKCEVTF